MSLENLQERLVALQESTAQLKELIDRLANLKFQPESPASAEDDTAAKAELTVEIGQLIREEEDELELLQEEAADARGGRPGNDVEHQRVRLREGAARLAGELQGHRVNFRKSQMTAKRNLEEAQRRDRELVLRSFSQTHLPAAPVPEPDGHAKDEEAHGPHGPPRRDRRRHRDSSSLSREDRQTVAANSDVTNALRSMHDAMAAELSKSEFAQQTLLESMAAVRQLGESYGSLGSVVASSVDLVGTLLRSQKSDTWYLQTSFYMLLATLAWLVFRRFLYGPLWWLVWLPVKLLAGGSWRLGSAIAASSGSLSYEGEGGVAGGGGGGGGGGSVDDAGQGSRVVKIDGMVPEGGMPTMVVAGDDIEERAREELAKHVEDVIRNGTDGNENEAGQEDGDRVPGQAAGGFDHKPTDEKDEL